MYIIIITDWALISTSCNGLALHVTLKFELFANLLCIAQGSTEQNLEENGQDVVTILNPEGHLCSVVQLLIV